MQSLLHDFRFGARLLIKKPGFTIVAVITLALGLGANTLIFSIVDGVLLRPLPYAHPERLVMLAETKEQVQNRWVSYPNFLDWRQRAQSFEALSTLRTWAVTMSGDPPETINAGLVAADYFAVMEVAPLLGRTFVEDDDNTSAKLVCVISYDWWQTRLGADPEIVGKSIILDQRPYTVIGVMPGGFRHLGPPPLWLLIGQMTGKGWMMRDSRVAGYVIGRLKPDITIQQARAEMDGIASELNERYPYQNASHAVRIVPLQDNIVGPARPMLLTMVGAVGLVLLIACTNVANLLLVHASARQRELAIRSALGANRFRIIRQLLSETVVLFLFGGSLGVLIASWGKDLITGSRFSQIPRLDAVSIDWRVMGFALLMTMVTGMLCGLVPAWRATRLDLQQALNASGRISTNAGKRLRAALVVAQVALAVILLVGAGLLIKSLARLLSSSFGFDSNDVLTLRLALPASEYTGKSARFQQELLDRIAALPGIQSASISNNLPGIADGWQNDISPEPYGRINPGEEINVDWSIVSPAFFETMRIPVLKGRTFTRNEAENGAPVVVIDENLARQFWPDGDAVGKHLKYDSPAPHEIIGVVGNVARYGSEALPRIRMYTPFGRANLNNATLSLRLKGSDMAAVLAAITEQVHEMDKQLPVSDVAMLDDILGREAGPRKFNTVVLTIFAAIALALAAIGLYGVISYAVSQRTRDIGVRIALGAVPGRVLRLVLAEGLRLAIIGLTIGLTFSYLLTRLIASFLFGVSATDASTFLMIAALLIGVAAIASYVPARTAARVDPMIALRHE